jgi:hypothetical protein
MKLNDIVIDVIIDCTGNTLRSNICIVYKHNLITIIITINGNETHGWTDDQTENAKNLTNSTDPQQDGYSNQQA